jgi:drug/metabolite transporter (DMT)-like permease
MGYGLSRNARGAIWMLGAAALFSLNAAVVKELAATGIGSLQTVFARSVLGLVVLIPFLLASGPAVATKSLMLPLLQAAAGTVALMSHFFAWTKLPLATVTALIFTQPLFTWSPAASSMGTIVTLDSNAARIHWRTRYGKAGVCWY